MEAHLPKATEQHRKLQALAGEWSGEETIHPSPWDAKGRKATSKTRARMDLGGFFLIADYEQHGPDGTVCYAGHGVYGWDPKAEKYTMHWFDVWGMDPGAPMLGTWEGKTLRFDHKHERGYNRYIYVFEADGRYAFRIEMSQDGKNWAPFIDGTYQRK